MKISTKGRYSVMIMIYLAKEYKEDKYVSLNDIAKMEDISIKYLEKLMLNLKKYDFFITSRGGNGGYKLSKSPEEYKIGDIVRAAEEVTEVAPCINSGECPKISKCSSFSLWRELNDVINEFLDSKTLADYI